MSKIIVKEMMDAALHFGHQSQRWNPKMKGFLFGTKNGIHIMDLEKTQVHMEKALEFLKQVAASGRTIMMVSTKPQAAALIVDAAKSTKSPYVVNKWMPGLLTNFSTLKRRIKHFNDLLDQEKSGELEKYTKKEISKIKKELVKLQDAFGGVRELDRMPAVIFVADVVRDKIVVKEANIMKVPVVAICDSNSDPDGVDYVIPANDDAISSLSYIITHLKEAILEAKGTKK